MPKEGGVPRPTFTYEGLKKKPQKEEWGGCNKIYNMNTMGNQRWELYHDEPMLVL